MLTDASAAVVPSFRASEHRIARHEWLVAFGLALIVIVLMTCVKVVRLNETHGDDALFLQLTTNAGERGVGTSALYATVLDFIGRGLMSESAQQIAGDPLAATAALEVDEFRIHSYFILYPIGLIARVIPKTILLPFLFTTTFIGLALGAYVGARKRGISPLVATLFCALIVWHPAWADAFEWEFYPDRLFALLGFALMVAADNARTKPVVLLALAVACALINERCAAIAGIFLVSRALLYWRSTSKRRTFDIALGAALMFYAFAILHWYLESTSVIHQAYTAFFPSSVSQFFAYTQDAANRRDTELFFLASAPLLAIAVFELRAAAIAVAIMLPNILGNFGGALKVGWYSHYHDLYLPTLVWAALLGLSTLDRSLRARKATPALPLALALVLALVFFYEPATATFSGTAYKNAFVHRLPDELNTYLGAYGARLRADADRIRANVPAGAMISTVEAGMPLIYDGRIVEFYPLGIERANYVLVGRGMVDGRVSIVGATTKLGVAEQKKIDAMLEERLRRDGYDVDHPVLETINGLALIKRR